jgi:PKD repeat protein
MRLAFTVCTSLILSLLLSGCSSDPAGNRGTDDVIRPAPSADELTALLHVELDRLGIDPERHPASAPTGPGNAVLNLAAYVVDPDGNGPGVPTEVQFSWAERNIGDYNQDGLVAVHDLTPLGLYFGQAVDYDDPALHGGIESWPCGNPLDDGGVAAGEPPAAGSPAMNWRRARVDGTGDGEINISDITPIAQNWQHWLDGYRVYRKRPVDSTFTLLPHPSAPSADVSVARGDIAADPLRPACYEYVDADLGVATGVYEYYVVAYDGNSDEEGEPSATILVDLDAGGGGTESPIAVLIADVYEGDPPLTVNFDAAGSYDPDPGGSIAKHEWDTDGDPSTWELDTGMVPTYSTTYTTAGYFEQWVRVTDNDGRTGTASVTINTAGDNELPVADLVATPDSGTAPLIIELDARGSYDPDGNLAEFEYDPEGDGTWMAPTVSPVINHTYQWGGTYLARVRVRDNLGGAATASCKVALEGDPPQHAPVAQLIASPASGEAPLDVVLDASGSTDQDDDIAGYFWDLDGDGFYTQFSGTDPTFEHTFTEVGTFTVGVKVKDSYLNEDTATVQVEVQPGSAFWHVYPADDTTSGNFKMDVSLAEVNGRPAIAYWNKSGEEIIYARANDALGTEWGTPFAIATGTNEWGGKCSLAVINGNPAVCYYWAVNAYHGYLMYKRSDDAHGAMWLSPITVVGDAETVHCWHTSLAEINGRPAIAFREMYAGELQYVRSVDAVGDSWPDPLVVMSGDNPGFYVRMRTVHGNPALCHIQQQNSHTVWYQRAADANGADWNSAGAIDEGFLGNGYGGGECSMAVINGNPAVCFFDYNAKQLRFIRANDADGNSWGSEQILDDSAQAGRYCKLAEAGGRAYIVYYIESAIKLMAIHAADANASTWHAPELIAELPTAYIDAAEISGQSSAAFIAGNTVHYAVKY